MEDYAEALLTACGLESLAVYRQSTAAQAAAYADLSFALAPPVETALRRAGIGRLYSHQVEAVEHAVAGRPVLVVTPTASGKSLVYNLPVLQACAADARARALYLFPFKALEQDQKAAFEDLASVFPAPGVPRAAIYDGDTPVPLRRRIKADPPNVLITNPDMLHLAILAHHPDWAGFLAGLRYVVLDELHVYRGVFGSHMHHILQRLRRICRLYGSRPVFISASATVGSPGRLARDLTGEEFAVVDRSGAPRSGRHFVFLDSQFKLSPYTAATRLMARTLADGRRTITFTKARRITELIQSWLLAAAPGLRGRVASYRAGYLPEERRAIETRLASGEILGVVSTSALELGVDIGGLDVCILVGYPGSITSAWQRIGRAGRQDRDSLVLLVGMPDALDQYFLRHPAEFFDRPFEPVTLDRANRSVAEAHLICAAAESPLGAADAAAYGAKVFSMVPGLAAQGRLLRDAAGERWMALARRPQRDISLRSMGSSYAIRHAGDGRPLGSIDAMRARLECHAGAIYLHAGRTYLIASLDMEKHQVLAEPADGADFFTQVLSEKQTEILETLEHRALVAGRVCLGRLKVTTWFKGFVRKRITDQEIISEEALDLPPSHFETVGLWVELPPGLAAAAAARSQHFMGAIHATEHTAIGLFPLLALCDRADLGGISYPLHPQVKGPAFFIYDGHAGGIGLAAEGYARLEELLGRTRELLAACPCTDGCPSCVQSPKCGNGNRPLDKAGALYLLRVLTGSEPEPPAPPGQPQRPAAPVVAASRATPAPPARLSQPAPPPATTELPQLTQPAIPAASGQDLPLTPDLFFDLETLRSAEQVGGWGRIAAMGLALAVVYDRGRDRWRTYREGEAKDLIIDLLSARRVVGFNVKRFDYTVLSAYAQADFGRVETLDLLEEIKKALGFRISLGHLAQATLGEPKSADGLASLEWVRQGRWDLVEEYCRKDVELTMRLFDHGRRHGHLLFLNRDGHKVRLPVSWTDRSGAAEHPPQAAPNWLQSR